MNGIVEESKITGVDIRAALKFRSGFRGPKHQMRNERAIRIAVGIMKGIVDENGVVRLDAEGILEALTTLKFKGGFWLTGYRARSTRASRIVMGTLNGTLDKGSRVEDEGCGDFVGDGVGRRSDFALAGRAVVETVTWNGTVAFADTANDVGTFEQAAPAGAPVQARVIEPANPFMDSTSS